MNALDDRRRCPHCGRETSGRPYLMARRATENVLSPRFILLVIVFVVALTVFSMR